MPEINTINDMERIYYTLAGRRFLQQDDLNFGFGQDISKAVITTSTTGVYQAVLGAQAWIQLNMEANIFGILPKTPWGRSGARVVTARALTMPTAGVAEDGSIPSALNPTFASFSTKPKTALGGPFEITEVHDALAENGEDDLYSSVSDMRVHFALEHREDLNEMMGEDFDTLASNAFESIDRVTATNSEQSGVGATAGDEDIYGIDRSASSWADAQSNHNSGTDRDLTDTLLQTLHQNIQTNGGNPTVWVTGWDSWRKWNALYDPQVRFTLFGENRMQGSVNGIQTVEGINTGTKISHFLGLPVIISKDVAVDTISRVYLLDTSNPEGFAFPRLSVKILKPTQYFEAGVSTGTPLELGKFNTRGIYRTVGELWCTFFKAQGKLRDLQ